MGDGWEIQEDRFDDLDSDERTSNYDDDDLDIDDCAVDEQHRSNEELITDYIPPRLSTIAEESRETVAEENAQGTMQFRNAEDGNGARGDAEENAALDSVFGPSFANMDLNVENASIEEGSSQFEKDGARRLQQDQESFFRVQDNAYRVGQYFEKENSWEPSVHFSPPPVPKIRLEEHAASNVNDPRTISVLSPRSKQKSTLSDVENTPPNIQHLNKKDVLKQNIDSTGNCGPKMSTPKSLDGSQRSLRDLSINCLSSIYPDPNSPRSHGVNLRSCRAGATSRKIPVVEKEQSLTSSAIDRVLESDNFKNDDELVNALLKAKTCPRLKLNFPKAVAKEQSETNGWYKECDYMQTKDKKGIHPNDYVPAQKVVTKHDRSGITNKTKKLKTIQELNSLRRSSLNSDAARMLSSVPKTKWNSGSLTTQCNWKGSTNTDTTTVFRAPSSMLRQADAENQGKFLSCDQSFVYFGFVDVKCRVTRTIRLRNISSKALNLRLQLHSVSKGYELLEQGIIVLKPQEAHNVHIVFEPPFGACFQNILRIRVLNAEHINYSIPLLGSGGVAALRVLTHSGLNMLRDGSFVLTAQGVTNITFDVENKGQRDAFVRIVVLDKDNKRAIDGCSVLPSDCVSILRRSKQRFNIAVPSVTSDEMSGNSCRSLFSVPSQTGSAQYYVQLLWGEEAQRRRLKRYEDGKRANFTFNGYSFSKCKFINEETCKSTASEVASCGSYDRDAFELGLRITLISVVDNRLSLASKSYHPEERFAESVILEPNATMSSCEKSVVEDVSTFFVSSRLP